MGFSCESRLVKPADRPKEKYHCSDDAHHHGNKSNGDLSCWICVGFCVTPSWVQHRCLCATTCCSAAANRRQIRPFTSVPTDAAQVTKIPACCSENIYFVAAVFVFKTFTFVLITLSAQHQLWHHGILSLSLPSHFSSILASDKH